MPLPRTALWIGLSILILMVAGYALWTRPLFLPVIRVDCQSIPLLGIPFSISWS
jgi:hypothetical protein